MIILYIFIAIFILIIVITIISPKKLKNNFIDELKLKLNENKIEYELNPQFQVYDYELKLNNQIYLLKFIHLPTFATVQINSKTTWEIKYGSGNKIGKADPYKKMLTSVSSFIKFPASDYTEKIFILIPNAKNIVMYINECEIIQVTPNTNVYQTKVINKDDFFTYLLKNKKH